MCSWPYRILAILLTLTSLLAGVPATAVVAGPTLTALTLNPTTVTGGVPLVAIPPHGRPSALGTVTLSGPAPSGGLAIGLSSNNTAVATVPGSVTVPAGATAAKFPIQASPVASSTSVTISASHSFADPITRRLQQVTETAALTVVPPALASLTLNPTSVTGGSSSTGTVALTGPAYSGGINITLDSSNPAVAQPSLLHIPLPPLGKGNVTVAAGHTSATFTVQTKPVPSQTSVTISASFGGVTKMASLMVVPPVLTSLTLNPTSVTGGSASTGTVFLSGPAYSGGVTVTVDSSNGAVARVPTGVTVPAGHTSATFTVQTKPVPSQTSVTISASYGGVTKHAALTVLPLALSSLNCTPSSVTGGNPVTCTVALTGPAYSGGLNVTLSSSKPAVATVPAGVTVPTGQTTATLGVPTQPVTTQTSVTISASYGGVTKTVTLTVKPVSCADPVFRLTVYPTSFTSIPTTGATVNATVNLGTLGPAPQGGAVVKINKVDNPPATGGPAAQFPATVTVGPGGCGVTFAITVFRCTQQYASCTNGFRAEYQGQPSTLATVGLPVY